MGYIKKNMIRGLVLLGVLAVCMTACGKKASNMPEDDKKTLNLQNDKNETAEEKISGEEPEAGELVASEKKEDKEAGISSSGAVEKEEKEEETMYSEASIPVYGKEGKKKVRSYLAKLPDKALSFQEAKELGVICQLQYKGKFTSAQKKYFERKWMNFYKETRKWKEEHRENVAHHDIGCEMAVITLYYTVEGDPIYSYISFINGEYYLYSDYSKDKFGGGFHEGSYAELRSVVDKVEDEEYSFFYLLAEERMSNKKIKQEDSYDIDKLILVYQFDYAWGND